MSKNKYTIASAIEHLLASAKSTKTKLEVLGSEQTKTAISFQKRKMDQFSFSETHQLGVRVIDGKHEGLAYTESLDPDALDNTLAAARANAKMIEQEWVADLAPDQKVPEFKGLFSHELADAPIEQKIKSAELLESTALDYSPDISSVAYGGYGDNAFISWIANTEGLIADFKQNYIYSYAYCLAKDGDNTVMDGESRIAKNLKELDVKAIATTSAQRALARRGSIRPQTGRYTVVFENRAAMNLIGMITSYFSAKEIDSNQSPLKGKLGQKILSENLTITDDPTYLIGLGFRPFDDEGYATKKTALVDKGVVQSFLTNSVLARKLKLTHTASASRTPSTDLSTSTSSVIVTPGTKTFDQLVNAAPQVIVITSLKGMAGFRRTSGDFSVPMEGFLYESGQRTVALKDFLISGNILDLLKQVEAVGNDVLPPIGVVISPSILIPNVSVSGQA